MTTINDQLTKIKNEKRLGLMTHVVVGYPSLQETATVVTEMVAAGVDFIELQIPFSDPLADGPVIMQANDVALAQSVTVTDCLTIMSQLSAQVPIPLLFMAYYNTVFTYGVERFCKAAAQAGCQGLIVPDMPIDEENHEGFVHSCQKYGL